MNSRRLARLMGIICDIKAHPRRSPDEMCERLGVSRRQFYKDRDTLDELGFGFHYSRQKNGFILDREITFNVSGQSLADLFALILAVRQLTQLDDFALAMGALDGLRNMVGHLPGELSREFQNVLDQVVVADGFGCSPRVLAELRQALREGFRTVLVLDGSGSVEERLDVLPRRMFLKDSSLFLEVRGLEGESLSAVALSRVKKVITTPLFTG